MTGTDELATLALARALPEIGQGCSRIAYRFGDTVYKVETSRGANLSEFYNASMARGRVVYPFVIPEMALHYVNDSVVLSMPYIDGIPTGDCVSAFLGLACECDGNCMPPEIAAKAKAINGDSLSWGNTIRVGEEYVIIDFDADEVAS